MYLLYKNPLSDTTSMGQMSVLDIMSFELMGHEILLVVFSGDVAPFILLPFTGNKKRMLS